LDISKANFWFFEKEFGQQPVQMSFFAIEYLRLQTHLAIARTIACPGHSFLFLLGQSGGAGGGGKVSS